MTDELVHVESSAGVLTMTLDSPHNRNALSSGLIAELRAGLERAAADSDVRAVVLTHVGSTFCAGADLSESGLEGGPAAGTARLVELLRAMIELPVPVVSYVDGHVRAGGLGILGASDMAIASDSSTFAFTEARLGLAPAIISVPLLPKLDQRAASRYLLTGEVFGGPVAQSIGLVTISDPDPKSRMAETLGHLRLCSPQGLAETKRLTTAVILDDFDERASAMAALSARLFDSDEAIEGITAFMEKRSPSWVPETP